jgi:hypothetical protein
MRLRRVRWLRRVGGEGNGRGRREEKRNYLLAQERIVGRRNGSPPPYHGYHVGFHVDRRFDVRHDFHRNSARHDNNT